MSEVVVEINQFETGEVELGDGYYGGKLERFDVSGSDVGGETWLLTNYVGNSMISKLMPEGVAKAVSAIVASGRTIASVIEVPGMDGFLSGIVLVVGKGGLG